MPPGFIQDELDLKVLVLYILSKAAGPLLFDQLLDLALCDRGVDYFSLTHVLGHMEATGQLVQEGDRYVITERGRRNSAICETSLPYSVRMHCNENLKEVNRTLRREAQVQTELTENQDGTCVLHLGFDDGDTPLLRLELLTAGRDQGAAMIERFREDPGRIYHGMIQMLSEGDHADEKS